MLLRKAVMEEAGPRTLEKIIFVFIGMELNLVRWIVLLHDSFSLDCHLLGKSSPKRMKGTGPRPHAYPKVIRIQEITGTRLKL